jgi:hypothetical protein
MDLQLHGGVRSGGINCPSLLEVECGAPGIGATRKFRKVLKTGRSRTYIYCGCIQDKLRVIDRDIGVKGINCTSILKKAKLDVPPPRTWRKSQEKSWKGTERTYVVRMSILED